MRMDPDMAAPILSIRATHPLQPLALRHPLQRASTIGRSHSNGKWLGCQLFIRLRLYARSTRYLPMADAKVAREAILNILCTMIRPATTKLVQLTPADKRV